MTLLTMITNVCAELNLDQITSVISNNDPTTQQLLRLAQRAGDEMARDYDWSDLVVQRSFAAISSNIQTEPPADFERYKANSSLWNNSRLWKLNGPVEPDEWQRLTIINSQPVPQVWRTLGGKLAIYPPVAGETLSYEYLTKNWIQTTGSTTATWQADTDTAILSERIIELSVIYRWKKAKGFEYGGAERDYDDAMESEVGSDRAAKAKSLSKPNRGQVPGNYWPGQITP